MSIVTSLAHETSVSAACYALNVSRCGFYRWKEPKEKEPFRHHHPPLALSYSERNEVIDVLHEDRFVDKAPQEIYAALLDEDKYLCSIRTMYRILEKEGELKERRNQLSRPTIQNRRFLHKVPMKSGPGILPN